MNELQDGQLLTTQELGILLFIAVATIGALIATSSRSGDGRPYPMDQAEP